MRRFAVVCAAAAMAAFAATAVASEENAVTAPSEGPNVAAKIADGSVVCKKVTTTGSRLGTKQVCKTAEEWEREGRDSRESARALSHQRGASKGQ